MSATRLPSRCAELAAASADPAAVTRLFEALGPEVLERLEADFALAAAVAAIGAASRSLARTLLADPAALDALAALDRPVALDESDAASLVRTQRRALVAIAARDLLGLDTLETVGERLAELADRVLHAALRLAQGTEELLVVGMGKLGARELNYASDVDLVLVGQDPDHEPTRHRALSLLEVVRRCYRVDLALRPEGRAGPLVRSLDAYRAYWQRFASAWEIQALLKARPVAGDAALSAGFAEAVAEALWERRFGADELHEIRTMKARAEKHLRRRGLADRELKLGPGGIRDIEFSVQVLELVHGRHDASIRLAATLPALEALGRGGYIEWSDAEALGEDYRYLRTVEHRLQLLEEQQVHAVPDDPKALDHLARVLGHRSDAETTATARLLAELRRHRSRAREVHERLFFRPVLDALVGLDGRTMPDAALPERLAAFGFRDPKRTQAAIVELTRGVSRSSRLLAQMLALVFDWLSASPDPDLGLTGLRALARARGRSAELVATVRDAPEAARRMCLLLGTGRPFLEAFEHDPRLLADLDDDRALSRRGRAALEARADAALEIRAGTAQRRSELLRLRRAEATRIAARDVLGLADELETGAALTELAEAVLSSALRATDPGVPLAVVAMGSFGGAELTYASDLDVLYVFDGGPECLPEAERAVAELVRLVHGETPAARVYELDADLRPEGRQGPLVRSLAAYRAYYERWAQTWERQALLRARPVAGDPELSRVFGALADEVVLARPFGEDDVRAVRRMKARVERERLPRGGDPEFHLKLGKGGLADVQWTVQLLELRHGIREPSTIEGLARLEAEGWLDAQDAAALKAAFRFCTKVRDRLAVMGSTRPDALPSRPEELRRLARSLGTTPALLREEYRRVTRRSRRVVERRFYGLAEKDTLARAR